VDHGLVEKVDTGPAAVNHYRVTATAIAAMRPCHSEVLRRFLVGSVERMTW
jgi:hypothetical protein